MTSTETLSIVIALSMGVFSIVGVMVTLFLWNRGESNSDRRYHGDSFKNLKDEIDRLQNKLHRMERRK